MIIKDLIAKLIYCSPDSPIKCLVAAGEGEEKEEYDLHIKEIEVFNGPAKLILEDIKKASAVADKENKAEKLIEDVEKWADDKDLLHRKNSEKQFLKMIEEVFEFKSEYDIVERTEHKKLREIYEERMKVEMGDILVTTIILCKQLDIDPLICLEKAYKKISKRKGKTINGTFIKQEDL